jgi:DNA-directed RNA polymerase specialized sigma24 family protein
VSQPSARFQEICAQIEALTDEDWLRLRKAASCMLYGTRLDDPMELLQETIARALEGSRNWPVDIPFHTFFLNAAKSVADNLRKLKRTALETPEADLGRLDEDPIFIESIAANDESPEIGLLAAERLSDGAAAIERARLNFREDPDARCLLRAAVEGKSAAETRHEQAMTTSRYDAARKRIARYIRRLPARK